MKTGNKKKARAIRANTSREDSMYDHLTSNDGTRTGIERVAPPNYYDDPLAAQAFDALQLGEDVRDARLHGDARTRKRWKMNLIGGLTTLCVVAVVLTLSLLMLSSIKASKSKTTNSSSSSTDISSVKPISSTNISTVQTKSYLPPPPNNVKNVCMFNKINESQQQQQECQDICDKADCCTYPTIMALSCLIGNYNICLQYHKYCWVLDSKTVSSPTNSSLLVPTAPNSIYDVCSTENIKTPHGQNDCMNTCKAAECCYTNQGEVCVDNPACDTGYDVCLILNTIWAQNLSTMQVVDRMCSNENIVIYSGSVACKTICEQAYCCWNDDLECPSPVTNNNTFCTQYERCKVLLQSSGGLHNQSDKINMVNSSTMAASRPSVIESLRTISPSASTSNTETLSDIIDKACQNPLSFHCLSYCKRVSCCYDPSNITIACRGVIATDPSFDCSLYHPCDGIYH